MEIVRQADGRVLLRQRLVCPVVYLDHWAVRLFSEDMSLQDRFVDALQQSRGTWLFACANLMEFAAMTDLDQAVAAEELLRRAMPSVYVADLYSDPGFALPKKAVPSDDPPDEHWMLEDLAARAHIAGGTLNTTRFVQEAVLQRAVLLPLFVELKQQVANAVRASVADEQKRRLASKFRPVTAMDVSDALLAELLREPHVNQAFRIDDHDAMDLVHTVPAATVCDYLLLDRGWTSRECVGGGTQRHLEKRAHIRRPGGGWPMVSLVCYLRRKITTCRTPKILYTASTCHEGCYPTPPTASSRSTTGSRRAAATGPTGEKEPWNGEFYVSYGGNPARVWEEARQHGFISAGGGTWYSQTLKLLSPGDRVWVKIPKTGYVGVGRVMEAVQAAKDFTLPTNDGVRPALDVLQHGAEWRAQADDPEKSEYFVRVQWLQTVPESQAFNEVGLFGNQNSVCRPTTSRWRHTVERLKAAFPNWAG